MRQHRRQFVDEEADIARDIAIAELFEQLHATGLALQAVDDFLDAHPELKKEIAAFRAAGGGDDSDKLRNWLARPSDQPGTAAPRLVWINPSSPAP